MTKENEITASVIAERFQVAPNLIRYYTRIGLLNPQRDPHNNYKIYGKRDFVRLRFVLLARELGFTLEEIRQILEQAEAGASPCPAVREIVEHHVAENHRKIRQLNNLQEKLEKTLLMWEEMPDAVPSENSICHLVESSSLSNKSPETLLDLSLAHTFKLLI